MMWYWLILYKDPDKQSQYPCLQVQLARCLPEAFVWRRVPSQTVKGMFPHKLIQSAGIYLHRSGIFQSSLVLVRPVCLTQPVPVAMKFDRNSVDGLVWHLREFVLPKARMLSFPEVSKKHKQNIKYVFVGTKEVLKSIYEIALSMQHKVRSYFGSFAISVCLQAFIMAVLLTIWVQPEISAAVGPPVTWCRGQGNLMD